jgi:CheY-like chemotaxis protein
VQVKPQKILVIDDDPYLVEVMSASLRILGHFEVITAMNGAEGLILCTQEQPEIVVVDISMPEIDGYQVIRALRGDPATSNIPIVVLSARVQHDDRVVGVYAGADVYLTKPLNPMELVESIRHALTLTQKQRIQRQRSLAGLEETLPPEDF